MTKRVAAKLVQVLHVKSDLVSALLHYLNFLKDACTVVSLYSIVHSNANDSVSKDVVSSDPLTNFSNISECTPKSKKLLRLVTKYARIERSILMEHLEQRKLYWKENWKENSVKLSGKIRLEEKKLKGKQKKLLKRSVSSFAFYLASLKGTKGGPDALKNASKAFKEMSAQEKEVGLFLFNN